MILGPGSLYDRNFLQKMGKFLIIVILTLGMDVLTITVAKHDS